MHFINTESWWCTESSKFGKNQQSRNVGHIITITFHRKCSHLLTGQSGIGTESHRFWVCTKVHKVRRFANSCVPAKRTSNAFYSSGDKKTTHFSFWYKEAVCFPAQTLNRTQENVNSLMCVKLKVTVMYLCVWLWMCAYINKKYSKIYIFYILPPFISLHV